MAGIRRWLRRLMYLAVLFLALGAVAIGVVYWLVAPRLPMCRNCATWPCKCR